MPRIVWNSRVTGGEVSEDSCQAPEVFAMHPEAEEKQAVHASFTCSQLWQTLNRIILESAEPETLLGKTAQILSETFSADSCIILSQESAGAAAQLTGWSVQRAENRGQFTLEQLPAAALAWPQSSPLLVLTDLSDLTDVLATTQLAPEMQAAALWCQAIAEACQLPLPRSVLAINTNVQTNIQNHWQSWVILFKTQPDGWTDAQITDLTTLKDGLASATTHAARQKYLGSLERQSRLAQQFYQLSQRLSQTIQDTLSLEHILDHALSATAQILGVRRGLLLLLKYERLPRSLPSQTPAKARITVTHEWDANLQETSPFAIKPRGFSLSECTICQQMLMSFPQPLAIANLLQSPEWATQADQSPALLDVKTFPALLMVPVAAPTNSQVPLLGFLVLQHDQPRPWQTDEIELVKATTVQLSVAIIHHQTLHQVQSLVEERTTQSNNSQKLQTKLYEVTRQQVEQLRHLNHLKDEFISTLSHELRTPLTSMALAIRMLRQPGITPERTAKYLDILEQQCTQETNLINDLLLLQELEANQSPLQGCSVNLKSLIESCISPFEHQWAAKELHLMVELPAQAVSLYTVPQYLQRIFQELLTNAGKFSHPNQVVYLKMQYLIAEGSQHVQFQVVNYGLGIPATDQPQIFDKFRRGSGATQQAIPGVGLGLALVKYLTKQLHATIAVSSIPCASDGENDVSCPWETCFTLTLPLSLRSVD